VHSGDRGSTKPSLPSSTSSQSDFPKVTVIGGSIRGLFVAIALRSVNCDVEVFEKSPANIKGSCAGVVMQMQIVNFLRAQYCPESVPKYTYLQKIVFEKR
jgi:2-polyprenyl-6-methoxyphenol hydroxylase-like FAD-dependent oxidoreductase